MAGEWHTLTVDQIKAKEDRSIAIGPFGSRMKANTYVASGVPVIRGNNISDTRVFVDDYVYVSEETADELRACNVFAGDLVFPHRGAIGQVGIVPDGELPRFMLSTSLMKLTCDKDVIDPLFVFYFFRSALGRHALLEHASTVGTPGIGQPLTSLRSIKLPIPPFPEQRAIAHIPGTLDDKIELNRRRNQTLEAMARALFKDWFVDFGPVRAKMEGRESYLPAELWQHFPDRLDDDGKPEGWEGGKIQDCCLKIQNGGTPRRNEPRFWNDGNIPWLTSAEVRQPVITETQNFITQEGLQASSAKWVPEQSTVIALYGATAGQVSFVSTPLTTNQAVCALIPKEGYAFFNYLNMRAAISDLENKAVGSAQQNISKGIVEQSSLIIPLNHLVEIFDQVVSPFFQNWISNLGESCTLAQLRDTLLPKLISGELRVPDATRMAREVA